MVSIYISNTPPEGDNMEHLSQISLEELQNLKHFKWLETEHDVLCLEALYLGKVSERTGWGVFARQFIPKGTVLGYYVGEIKNLSHIEQKNYEYGLSLRLKDEDQCLDAQNVGNITRFFQHFPSQAELAECYAFPSSHFEEKVMTENVAIRIQDNKIYFYTIKDIYPGRPVGFSYGMAYWENSHRIPLLFDLLGRELPQAWYQYRPSIRIVSPEECPESPSRIRPPMHILLDNAKMYTSIPFIAEAENPELSIVYQVSSAQILEEEKKHQLKQSFTLVGTIALMVNNEIIDIELVNNPETLRTYYEQCDRLGFIQTEKAQGAANNVYYKRAALYYAVAIKIMKYLDRLENNKTKNTLALAMNYYNRGLCCIKLNALEQAKFCFTKALELRQAILPALTVGSKEAIELQEKIERVQKRLRDPKLNPKLTSAQ